MKRFTANLVTALLAPVLASTLAFATPALASGGGKTVVMTPTTVNAALAALAPGDTLRMQGTFTNRVAFNNRDFGGVQVDASGAVLLQGINIGNTQNIAFTGGVFGRSDINTADWYIVRIDNSSNVSVSGASFQGNGDNHGSGLLVTGSSFVTVRDNQFHGHQTGLQMTLSQDSLVFGNRFTGSTSDGAQLISNSRVILAENSCSGFNPPAGGHPDCIQFFNTGGTLQSQIYVLNNRAVGRMQGIFAGGNPNQVINIDFTIAGNYTEVTYPHGISCYGCINSLMENNIAVSPFGPNHLSIIQYFGGSNNELGYNPIFDFRNVQNPVWPEQIWSYIIPSIAGLVGSVHANRSYNSRMIAQSLGIAEEPVPEPATWVMLLMGFALVGRQLRRQGGPAHVLA